MHVGSSAIIAFMYIGAIPLTNTNIGNGLLFGPDISFDCEGEEMMLSECPVVSLLPYAKYDHTNDTGVTCERCIDHCDFGSTRNVFMTTESSNVESNISVCSNERNTLGAIVGILIVLLVTVIIGWIATCILVQTKMKRKYNVDIDKR